MNVKLLGYWLASSKHHLVVNFYHYFSFFFWLDLSINPSFLFDPHISVTTIYLAPFENMGQQTMSCESKRANFPVLSIKFYWNTAMSIHLYIIYDCFYATTAELNSCNKKP